MFYHGFLKHPDIWTMWFDLFVCAGVCVDWSVRLGRFLWRKK